MYIYIYVCKLISRYHFLCVCLCVSMPTRLTHHAPSFIPPVHSRTASLLGWLTSGCADWLTNWLTHRFTDAHIHWLPDS